jgi:uncharacterized Zn-binding protein involved in type VI secretion
MPVELTKLSIAERTKLLRELAHKGRYPVTSGNRVQDANGVFYVLRPPVPSVLVDGRPIVTTGAPFNAFAYDALGCPACPHPALGTITTGMPDVLINGRPMAVAGSETNTGGWVMEGIGEFVGQKKTVSLAESISMRRRLVRG